MPPPVRRRTRALLEALEPRILYSADVAAVAGMVGGDTALAHEVRLQSPMVTSTAVAHEIAFVDLGVPDASALVSGLQAQRAAGRAIEVVTLTADEDGLAVISRTLAERQAQGESFAAVHVFSHGRAGEVQIGAAALDADSLLLRAGEIAGWGAALDAQADLMLYGCEVAADASGLFLIEGLAALTGADVAASDDLTGHALRGGDWVLEQQTGPIDTAVAADVAMQQTWDGVLGNEVQVNTTTAGNQNTNAETRGSQQAVTLDAKGNYVVVWTSDGQDGDKNGVFVRRFAYDGTPLTGELQVNTTTADQQQDARIVGDSAGNFAVVWSSKNQDGTASSVYFRRFDATGTALTGEIRANATASGTQSNAVIGMADGNGTVVVAWEGAGPSTGSVYFRRFAADGTALDAADRAPSTVGGELNAAVAMDSTGRFVLVWSRNNHLYFQRYDAAGAAAGGVTQGDNGMSVSFGSTVAMDAAGNFALAYREQDTIPGIWGRVFNADGSARAFWFNADTGDSTSPSISLGADGSAVIVYQKSGDGDGQGVYGRKISAGGAAQGSPFLINQSTAKDQVSASVAVHDANHFVVVWSGDSAADKDGIYARTFEPANTAPVITAPTAVSLAENTTLVTTVGASDTDWPTQTVSYAIVGGADQAKFSIDAQSGALRFVTAPDYEHPADTGADNVYDVTVQASDGLLGSPQAIVVTVTDVDDHVHATADTATTPYQTAVTVNVLANDAVGTGPALALLDLSTPAHGKAIVSGGQVVYTPDAGFVGADTFDYRVIDGSEGLAVYSSLDDFTPTTTTDPTRVAGVRGSALQFDGVNDAITLSSVSYTAEFTLSYWFKVASNSGTGYQYLYSHGAVSTQNSLNTYFIQDATPTASGTKDVLRTALIDSNDGTTTTNISALDIPATELADNQWHQYTLTTRTGAGSFVYIDGTLRASSTTQGSDAIAPTGPIFLGARNDLAAGRFLSGALDDVALYSRTFSAADVAAASAGPGALGTVTVQVTPLNTATPVITSDGGGAVGVPTVAENTTAVTTVVATDADVGGPALTYTLAGGEDQAKFAIDALTGVLTFTTAPDFEQPTDLSADNVYIVVVQASDGVHATTQTLKVVVSDVNEHALGPIGDTDAALDEVDENAATGTQVGLTALAVDADGLNNTVTYTLDDTAGGRFSIDALTGVVRVAGALDAEAANRHTLLVRATSSDGSSQTQSFTLTVRDLDEFEVSAPVDDDPTANTVRENALAGTVVGVTALARDQDLSNSSVTYSLLDDAGGRFAIDASRGIVITTRSLDAEAARQHDITVQARSTDGSVAAQVFTIVVEDVNEFSVTAPTDADAAADSVGEDAAVGTVVGLTVQAMDADVTNSAVTYALIDDAGGRFAIDASTGVITVAGALDAETALNHTITVRATSADASVAERSFTISVRDVNEFGVTAPADTDAAADSVREDAAIGTVVGITAQAADVDATNHVITYTLTDTAGGRFAIDASTGVITVAGPLDAETALSHTVTVRATSADASVAERSFTITVRDVNEFGVTTPADTDAAADSVREDAAIGTVVGITVQAVDADSTNSAVTYTLSDDAGGRFAIDASTGVITVAGALDAEVALSHTITVRAISADASVAERSFMIAVRDLNEFGVTTPTDADAAADSVGEDAAIGTVVGITAQAADADVTNHSVTYTLSDDAGGRFAIDASTGVITVAGALDAETALSHTVTVRATSADASVAERSFTITVRDVNEFGVTAPTDTDAAADSVREDAAVGTAVGLTVQSMDADVANHSVTYTLTDDAGGRFAIDANTGVVTVAGVLDAETALNHTITVRATSADASVAERSFTIAIGDVNEFGVTQPTDVDAAADSVREDAAVGTTIGITAQSVDADATNSAVTYTLTDDAGGRFAIDASTGVITVAGALDAETALSHTVTVQATSSDGSLWTQAFTVRVTDVDEFDLVAIDDLDGASSVLPEDTALGAAVGVTAHAVDADATNSAVTYALLDSAGGRFAIDATSGVITLASALDAETALSHTVTVQATSSDGSLWTQAFTVQVTDVDEFDLVAVVDADAAPDAVSENAAIGTRVGVTAQAVDADVTNSHVTYTLDDSAGGRFAVDAATGVVTLAQSVQEEGVASRTVVLRATSADGSTVVARFTLAIVPVNDAAPVIESDGGGAAASLSVAEGDTWVTQVIARDTDLPAPSLRYTLGGGADAAAFTLDAVSGALRFVSAPDAERPVDAGADNVYEVTVQVSDGERTDAQALRITVQPVNDLAPLIVSDGGGATALRHVAENATLVTQVQARDADVPADTLVYALAGGADAGLFTIDAATGVLRWRVAPDHETPRDVGPDQPYDVVVSVSDGLHVTTQALAVVVDNVDEAPSLDSATLTVREGGSARPVLVARDVDTPATRLVYTVQTVSGGWFESAAAPGVAITHFTQADADAGAVRFVTDGGEGAPVCRLVLADDTWTLVPLAVAVDFTPVNDAPVVAPVDLGVVDEDMPRLVTAAELLAGAGDAEGDALSVSNLRLVQGEGTLVDLGGGRWRLEPAADWNGAVTLAGDVSDGQASVALTASLQVRPVNDPPRLVSGDGAATVAREVAENTTAVDTVQAADAEPATPLRYAVVGGADAALFVIDAETGALMFRQPPDHEHPVDANGDGRYEVTVEVSDGDLRAQQALVVTVTNVDEAPVILRNTLLVSEGGVTLVLQASDPDTPATALTYLVDSAQGGQFERLSVPGTAITQFTQADIDTAQVVWVASAGSVRAAYGLRLSDGHSQVGIGAPTVQQQPSREVEIALTVQSLTVGDRETAPSSGEAATSAAALPSASASRRGDPARVGADASAEAGLGLGQGVSADPPARSGGGGRPGETGTPPARGAAARAAVVPVAERVEVAFDLPSEGTEVAKRLLTDQDWWASRSGTSLAAQIDRLRQEVTDAQQAGSVTLASTALVSTGLSVGYVVWLVRGGVLMTSLMSVVPAWAGMDPLPVLSEMRRAEGGAAGRDGEGDEGDDPIEKLFSKARRLLVRPVEGPTVTPAATPTETPGACT